MNRHFALLLILASVSSVVFAQDKAPAQLFEAAQCLSTEKHNWVNTKASKQLSLGYLPDRNTLLGDKYLYVVVYTTPKRNEGRVFDIRFKQEGHQHVYSIENSATFVTTKTGIEFSEPPQGGTWAQNQLTPAVQQIVHHKKWYEADVKLLMKPSNHLRCECYSDNP